MKRAIISLSSLSLEPMYSKGGTWLKYFGHSNSLCVRVTIAIVNHALIDEYRLRFFPQEDFKCLCSNYPIETRCHILHDCKRYNKYWNPRRDMISHFTLFLEFNSFVWRKHYYKLLVALLTSPFLCFLVLSFFLSFLFSFSFPYSCSLCLNVCSYKVATMVCPCTPCNKLLI